MPSADNSHSVHRDAYGEFAEGQMITEILAAVNFGLAAFDSYLTRRRIIDYGVNVELNPSIRWMVSKLGVDVGVLTTIAGMAVVQTAVCSAFHLSWVLGILIGIRGKLFLIQLQSLRFEKQLKAFKASLQNSPEPSDTLPDATSQEVPSHSGDVLKDDK